MKSATKTRAAVESGGSPRSRSRWSTACAISSTPAAGKSVAIRYGMRNGKTVKAASPPRSKSSPPTMSATWLIRFSVAGDLRPVRCASVT